VGGPETGWRSLIVWSVDSNLPYIIYIKHKKIPPCLWESVRFRSLSSYSLRAVATE